jgi:hypothetical protein
MNMMNELKLMVDMVAGLPNVALWVIACVFAYKVAVVGSIYGVVRFTVDRLYKWLVTEKTRPAREVEYKEIRPMLDGLCIKATLESLISQLYRIRNRAYQGQSEYIHQGDIDWLRKAIDAQIEKDAAEKNVKP